MTNQNPITPPPELVQQWADMLSHRSDHDVFSLAARWGADQELEACYELTRTKLSVLAALSLRAARRPKPPSLKEQALRVLVENGTNLDGRMELDSADIEIISRALNQLPNN
jgi:hypothetical protein